MITTINKKAWKPLADDIRPSFPLDTLPEACAELADNIATSLPVPPDYAACAILGAASCALVGRVKVEIKLRYQEPAQLYLGMVGGSGTKKSPVMSLIGDPLEEWLNDHRGQDMPDMETTGAEVNTTDSTPEALVVDMNAHQGRGIVWSDEGSMMNIMSGATYGKVGSATNIDVFLKAYDGKPVYVRRRSEGGSVSIKSANLAMTVGLQPNVVKDFTRNTSMVGRGLAQRFLFFVPEPLGRCVISELPELNGDLLDAWRDRITTLAAAFREQPIVLPMTDTAREAFNRYAQMIEDRRYEDLGGCEALSSWSSKCLGQVARISGLLTLLEDPKATEVGSKAVDAAIRMMDEYFIHHMEYVFCGERKLPVEAEKLLEAMKSILSKGGEYVLESSAREAVRKQAWMKKARNPQEAFAGA